MILTTVLGGIMKKVIIFLLLAGSVISADDIWKNYKAKDGLINNSIRTIAVDPDSVWFGTKSGMSRLNRAKNTWEAFTTKQGLPSNDIIALSASRGNIWIGTRNSGVSVYNKDSKTMRSFTKKDGLISNNITALLATPEQIWIGTDSGISVYDKSATSFTNYTVGDGLANNTITSIVSDGSSILVGTFGSAINVFNKTKNTWALYAPATAMYTNVVLTTQAENVWSGTNGGGIRVYNKANKTWQTFTRTEGLGDENLTALVNDGIYIWGGTFDGVSVYNTEKKSWKVFTSADGLADASISAIAVDGNYTWFGTDNGVTRFNKVIPEARIYLKKSFITSDSDPVEIECTALSYNKISSYKLEYATNTFPVVWLEKGINLPKAIEADGKLYASWNLNDIPSKIDFYNLRLTITDENGNVNEATSSLIIDTVAPQVVIRKDKDEAPIGIFTLGGTYNKRTIEKIIINPGNINATLNTEKRTFFAIVNLKEGSNNLSATATDWIGRTVTETIRVSGKKSKTGEEAVVQITQDDKNPKASKLTIGEKMLFDAGSAELKPTVYPLLDKIVDLLKKYADANMTIEGHTDNIPIKSGTQFASNQELSLARAKTVFQYFSKTGGIPVERIKVEGYGDTKPVASNATEEGRALNRRVEIIITGSK